MPYPPGVLCVVPGEVWAAPCCAISSRWRRGSICCPLLAGAAGGLQRDGSGRH
ncbi:hypothetical protein J4734_28400 [Klebsiella pneumoniae]|uniref:Uncharacterized protein n=1 Tax=Klebsiella pneumoniae TaxID=573 RepID=A0A939SWB7_KLEPN|nr:hypothetical protein [Klebsiella pneumoniae]